MAVGYGECDRGEASGLGSQDVRTEIDRVLTPALQERMIGNWHVEQVVSLEAGHFPALSVPEELAGALLSVGVAEVPG